MNIPTIPKRYLAVMVDSADSNLMIDWKYEEIGDAAGSNDGQQHHNRHPTKSRIPFSFEHHEADDAHHRNQDGEELGCGRHLRDEMQIIVADIKKRQHRQLEDDC